MRHARVMAVMTVLWLGSSLHAQELVDNPEYQSWSKLAKGTSLSIRSISVVSGRSSEVIITNTLVETTPEKVVIETALLLKERDQDFRPPVEKQVIAKMIALPKGISRTEFAAGKPPGTIEEGTETLNIAGRELKTKWYTYREEVAGTKIEGKRWFSSEVPGNIIKSELKTTGILSTTARLELIEFKKP